MSEFWALLNTYGAFAAGYLARPLGGIVMAHFGDNLGVKYVYAKYFTNGSSHLCLSFYSRL